jgi:hypothetical protein
MKLRVGSRSHLGRLESKKLESESERYKLLKAAAKQPQSFMYDCRWRCIISFSSFHGAVKKAEFSFQNEVFYLGFQSLT